MSNETDLDWLARNVHVWPEGKREVLVCWPRNVATLIWSYVLSDAGWITKEQWLARRAELQNKPSWVDAPEWGEWLAQDDSGEWYWYASKTAHPGMKSWWPAPGANNVQCGKGEVLGDWRDTLERRSADLSELAVTERLTEAAHTVLAAAPALMDEKFRFDRDDWHERGELPPVGVVCEAYIDRPPQWIEAEIVAHKDGFAIGWCKSVMKGCHGDKASEFRPIRTERDVLIEIIKKTDDTDDRIADAILAAGFKRGAA